MDKKKRKMKKTAEADIKTTASAKTFSEIKEEHEELSDPSSKKKKGKKKLSGFTKFIIIYAAALAFILIVGSIIFYIFLNMLEKSQPYNTAEEITAQFNSGSESLTEYLLENSDTAVSLEPDIETVIEYYVESIGADENTFSYVESSAYVEDAPAYNITLDGETIAEITLTYESKKMFGLKNWQLSSVNIADYITGTLEYDVTVPAGSVVCVNGITLDDTYLTDEDETPEILANVTEYIETVPSYDTYHITGLVNEPELTAEDPDGNALALSLSDDTYFGYTETSQEFIDSVSDRVESAIRSWGTYFINKSYTLSSYMLSGTEWYVYIFGSDEVDPIYVGFYGSSKIASYDFTVLTAENYIQYTDDCFTVDVSYEMELTFNTSGYSDDNQNLYATWVWVKVDDVWYIADVSYLDDEDEEESEEDDSSSEEEEEEDE